MLDELMQKNFWFPIERVWFNFIELKGFQFWVVRKNNGLEP